MKRGVVFLLILLILAGCASLEARHTRDLEQILTDAGFQMRAADTPEALAYLQTLPTRKMLVGSANGAPQYAYADPTGCQCLYVGNELNYEELRKLQRDRALAADQLRIITRREALDSLWRATWPPPLR